MAAAGWLVGRGFIQGRMGDRYVTVRGISERDVQANLALWPLRVVAADNDLRQAQLRLSDNLAKVKVFLGAHGIDPAGTSLQRLEVTDAFANPYQDASRVAARYIVEQTLMVRSEQPKTVLDASQSLGELLAIGVVVNTSGETGSSGPTFLFTNLNKYKPDMIAEATARAREGAGKFAEDSGSALGGMRHASQGLFEILPRDQAPGIMQESRIDKTLRVVTTIDYFLVD